jgi:hypothetical protein
MTPTTMTPTTMTPTTMTPTTMTPTPLAKAVWFPESLRLADVISRHDFDLREWRILEFLRRQSFGSGRLFAYVPRLDLFARATRITRGNVSTILRRLKACQIIREEPQWCYAFLLMPPPNNPAANWRVPIRMEEVEVIRQLELLPAPAGLQEALREGFVESCRESGIPGGAPGSYAEEAGVSAAGTGLQGAHTGVPDSGTLAHTEGRSRFGNGPAKRISIDACEGVPESGTAHCNIAMRNALAKKQNCNVTSVPDSGTVASGLNSEQQELFDLMGKAGAFGEHQESRGCWFSMVQRRFSVCQRLWAELRYAMPTRKVRNPGAFMMDLWKRWGKPDR